MEKTIIDKMKTLFTAGKLTGEIKDIIKDEFSMKQKEVLNLWEQTLLFRKTFAKLDKRLGNGEVLLVKKSHNIAETLDECNILVNSLKDTGYKLTPRVFFEHDEKFFYTTFYNYGKQLSELEKEIVFYMFKVRFPKEFQNSISGDNYDEKSDTFRFTIYNIEKSNDMIKMYHLDSLTPEQHGKISTNFHFFSDLVKGDVETGTYEFTFAAKNDERFLGNVKRYEEKKLQKKIENDIKGEYTKISPQLGFGSVFLKMSQENKFLDLCKKYGLDETNLDLDILNVARKKELKKHHPDVGGDEVEFKRVTGNFKFMKSYLEDTWN
jgi:hypothetical protein